MEQSSNGIDVYTQETEENKLTFTLLRISFDTDQKVIRCSVNGTLECQLHIVRISFDPFAKTINSDTANRISSVTDC